MQEIGIRLKADTRDAVRSVKQLEQEVRKIEDFRRTRTDDKGFMSEEDVKRFQRLAGDAEKVYRNFFRQYESIQRDFERKKAELERSLRQGVDTTQINALRNEIQRLQAQKNIMESQMTTTQQLYGRIGTPPLSDSGGGGAATVLTSLGGRVSAGALGMLGGLFAFSNLWGFAREGMGLVKSEEEFMARLGLRMGGYGGDFRRARQDAAEMGLPYGYRALETMQYADQFTSLAGVRDPNKAWRDTQDILASSRALGVDPALLTQTGGMMSRLGALDDGEQRKFANLLAGAIKKEGMEGRDRELIEAVGNLTEVTAQGRVSLSQSEMQQLVGLQAALGSAEHGLRGQRGADLLAAIDQGIKGGDSRLDLLLGWGSEFQGIAGRAEIERMKARGITDPEVVQRIFSNIDRIGGGNRDYQALMLSEIFGISIEQADRLLESDILDQLKRGGMSQQEIESLIKSGEGLITRKAGEYEGSDAARRARTEAQWEDTKRWAGEKIDALWYPFAEWFTGLSSGTQWGIMGAAAGGIAASGFSGLRRLFGRGGGSGSPAGGAASRIGGTASRFLGPLGVISGALLAEDLSDGLSDWVFGHSKGQPKRGLFASGVYEEDKKGLIDRALEYFGVDVGKDDPRDRKKMEDRLQIERKDNERLMLENQILDKRAGIIERQFSVAAEEKRNVETLMYATGGKSSPGSSSSALRGANALSLALGMMSGGLGSLVGGIGNTFGRAIGGMAKGNYAEIRNMSLKGQANLTADDINRWIASKAPPGSVMLGKGEVFLRAAQESGLDVRYLVAHAAHETAWGTSNIAKKKGNMYGIGAFDASPFKSAYGYDSVDAGIIEGAKWIAKNYVNKGQDTLYKMRHNDGKHEYATDPLWDEKIARIMAGAPKTSTLNVKVSGSIGGLTAENNAMVANALVGAFQSNAIDLAYEFRQGIGGQY